ncbi:MAG TPA: glutamine synthetase [Clostridiaceae bacterium]|nr:glutamine synthetase [Clostridiaceae bacterium]
MRKDLIYTIPRALHNVQDLTKILDEHEEIRFVSIAAVDLAGHETDTKIPIRLFRKDMDVFLNGMAAQTDGSSVVLPEIASLNNAKVDMKGDSDATWFVDYNYTFTASDATKPVGTIKIPCFLFHNGLEVDSRSILKNAEADFKKNLMEKFQTSDKLQKEFGISAEDIEEIEVTNATELEFWVKTPSNAGNIEELHTSQELKEQYWGKTRGTVRNALEETLILMENYGLSPEMGHKEVGGVRAKLADTGKFSSVLEQLEIDWRFSTPMGTGDSEIFIKELVRDVFARHGLEVTFLAKPIDGVAGSGEHLHIGVAVKLKSGARVNLFAPKEDNFLSTVGFGSLMGILKNYEVINPIVTATNAAFRRLKKGYEAPICIVTSLGENTKVPSRNRTVLIGLIRDEHNPLATRFELRSPNPHTNTFLATASLLMSMTDGINYTVEKDKSATELLNELSKEPNEKADYLEEGRAYRTEKDVFEDFTDEEREEFFGNAPSTVFENISAFRKYPEKMETLKRNGVFPAKILHSFESFALSKWITELEHRIIPNYMSEIREMKKLHDKDNVDDLDLANFEKVQELKLKLMKDTSSSLSMFSQVSKAVKEGNLEEVSRLQKEISAEVITLRKLYRDYKTYLIDC